MSTNGSDGESQRPKSLQRWLADTLRGLIADNGCRPGEYLESEQALCAKYEVSRVTVRGALALLEKEGVVQRNGRRGTLILQPQAGAGPDSAVQRFSGRIASIRWGKDAMSCGIVEGVQ